MIVLVRSSPFLVSVSEIQVLGGFKPHDRSFPGALRSGIQPTIKEDQGYERYDAGPSRIPTSCHVPRIVDQHVCGGHYLRVSDHFIQRVQASY